MRAWIVLALASCGRIRFDPQASADGSSGDDGVATGGALVAWYPLNELVATVPITHYETEELVGANNATCPAGACPTVVTAGHIDSAMQFSAGIDTVVLRAPAAPELDAGATGFTVAMWLSIDHITGGYECFAGKLLGAAVFNSWAGCLNQTGAISFYTTSAGIEDELVSPASFPIGGWHHVALTWNRSTKTIWLDGVAQTTRNKLTEFDNGDIVIGADVDSGTINTPFGGLIDELRIYAGALDATEIQTLASQ